MLKDLLGVWLHPKRLSSACMEIHSVYMGQAGVWRIWHEGISGALRAKFACV